MPKFATELTQGQSFSRTSEDAVLADTASRSYKVILSAPGEVFDPQAFCGVFVGSRHPTNTNLTCSDFSAKFDGDSRMVAIVTFNYRSNLSIASANNHKNPKQTHPKERPATWTSSSTLYEAPAYVWRTIAQNANGDITSYSDWGVPGIAATGERFEGVTNMVSMINFRIVQYVDFDPMMHHAYTQYVNSAPISIGSLNCNVHTLLVKGVEVEPHTEPFMGSVWQGYKVTYEIAYKKNPVLVPTPADRSVLWPIEVGWDQLQPVEGYKIVNSGLGVTGVDQNALALRHVNWVVQESPLAYADNTQGKVVAACVMLSGKETGRMQARASSPVALNLGQAGLPDGTPRDLINTVGGKYLSPILLRVQVQPEADLSAVFGLRLQA